VVLAVLAARPLSDASRARLGDLMGRFTSRLEASGVRSLVEATAADCDAFCWARTRRGAAPSLHTVHLRRTALRNLFAILDGLEPGWVDPTARLDLPGRPSARVRPLTDAEMHLVRTAALGGSRSRARVTCAVSLAEATATTGEVAQIRWRDLDRAAGSVGLPGAPPIRPRRAELTPWGAATLLRASDEVTPAPEEFVVPRRSPYADPHTAQAAMANLLAKLLVTAGVAVPGVRPSSIRLWGALQVLQLRGIEAAAAALGVSSLDVARRALTSPQEA